MTKLFTVAYVKRYYEQKPESELKFDTMMVFKDKKKAVEFMVADFQEKFGKSNLKPMELKHALKELREIVKKTSKLIIDDFSRYELYEAKLMD